MFQMDMKVSLGNTVEPSTEAMLRSVDAVRLMFLYYL